MIQEILSFLCENWIVTILCCAVLLAVLWFLAWKLWKKIKKPIRDLLTELFYEKEEGDGKSIKKFIPARLGVAILLLLMLVITLISFFRSESKFEITNGVLWILGLMLLVVFSGSIYHLKIGDVIELKKDIKVKEKEIMTLTSENDKLHNRLTTIFSASFKNENSIYYYNGGFSKDSKVETARKEEYEDSVTSETTRSKKIQINDREAAEKAKIKYIKLSNIPEDCVTHRAKFANFITNESTIMTHRAIFVGCIDMQHEMIFLEYSRLSSGTQYYYKLYYLLSLITQYAKGKGIRAKLVLLVPKTDEHNPQFYVDETNVANLNNSFYPAIEAGHLVVVRIPFSNDDVKEVVCAGEKDNT